MRSTATEPLFSFKYHTGIALKFSEWFVSRDPEISGDVVIKEVRAHLGVTPLRVFKRVAGTMHVWEDNRWGVWTPELCAEERVMANHE